LAWVVVRVRADDVGLGDGATRLAAALGAALLPVAVGLGRVLELVAVGLGRNVIDG